jgi:ATP-dependent protease ClpP protease subunit
MEHSTNQLTLHIDAGISANYDVVYPAALRTRDGNTHIDRENLLTFALDKVRRMQDRIKEGKSPLHINREPLKRVEDKYGKMARTALEEEPIDIALLVDSPGGKVVRQEFWAQTVDLLRKRGSNVWSFVGDQAQSAAFDMAMGADKTFCLPTSFLLSHLVSSVTPRSEEVLRALFRTTVRPTLEDRVSPEYAAFLKRRLDLAEVDATRPNDRLISFSGREAARYGLMDLNEDSMEALETFEGLSGETLDLENLDHPAAQFFASGIVRDTLGEINDLKGNCSEGIRSVHVPKDRDRVVVATHPGWNSPLRFWWNKGLKDLPLDFPRVDFR